ncbi:MAG: hypothetical protein J5659_00615 [Clostridia bacterium]|nr:hypothetical protein [Clostridia bacterium]
MKKLIALAIICLLILGTVTACKKAENTSSAPKPASIDEIKTLGDIIALGNDDDQKAAYDSVYIYAFKFDDIYYRAICNIPQETFDTIIDLDVTEEDYDKKLNKIIAPIKIDKMEKLEDYKLSQYELDALVGKTGKDLFEAGWTSSGHNLEDMEFWLNYGPFEYTVVFDGKVEEKDYEDFDDEEDTKDLVIKSIEYSQVGDATNIETE